MIRVKKVEVLEEYKLLVTFSNGENRIFDMKDKIEEKPFLKLKDLEFFKSVKVSYGTIVWNEEIDYCPDCLYEESIPVVETK